MAASGDDLISVGHIICAHGVRGQVKVYSLTSPRENILTYSPWVVSQQGQEFEAKVTGKLQGKNVIAKLHSVVDRDRAEELVGADILIRREQLPELGDGDFYWSQLIGLEVENTDGIKLGRVDQMIETGANDVMVVQGDRERLIPYVLDDVIKSVDLDHSRILVDWQEDF